MLKEISFNSYSLFGITSTSRRLQFKGSTPLDKYPSNPPFGLRLATSTVVSARAADDLSELQAKFADLTITTARDDITKAWTNVHAYMTSEAPARQCSKPTANALLEDILFIIKHTQTADPFLSQQQVRVFALSAGCFQSVPAQQRVYDLRSLIFAALPISSAFDSSPRFQSDKVARTLCKCALYL